MSDRVTTFKLLTSFLAQRKPVAEVLHTMKEDQNHPSMTPPNTFTRTTLEPLDSNLFLARKTDLWPNGNGSVYGGQVIGQALAAAEKTVPKEKAVHSTHCYFLRAGDVKNNIIYTVLPLRDGGAFSSRLVIAQQNSLPIFIQICSFQRPEFSSLEHQHKMPLTPPPDQCLTSPDYFQLLSKDPRCTPDVKKYFTWRAKLSSKSPIEVRMVQVGDPLSKFGLPPANQSPNFPQVKDNTKQIVWVRLRQPTTTPQDPATHRAILAYISDAFLLTSILNVPSYSAGDLGMMASRDHSMWFHADVDVDEWFLYETWSPRAGGARGLSLGKIFRQDGVLAVTCSQEGVVRIKKDIESKL